MRVIDDFIQGRDNNYNVIRFFAALAVIYSHSFPLTGTGGDPSIVPGESYGGFGVSVFFILSGFLVARSWDNNPRFFSFMLARGLRIYPALAVALALSIFVLWGLFGTGNLEDYLSNVITIDYFVKNMQMLPNEVRYNLPGIFESNPLKGAVNGSLWTLPWELWMYVAIAGCGLLGFFRAPKLFALCCVGLIAANVWNQWTHTYTDYYPYYFLKLSSLFFSGVFCYLSRRLIPMNLGVLTVFFAVFFVLMNKNIPLFVALFSLMMPYLVLGCAYLIKGPIRQFNRLGDYSYGLYIFAFPIQQACVSLNPGIGPMKLFCMSAVLTLVLSVLSWHLVEKPALVLKLLIEMKLKAIRRGNIPKKPI